MRAILSFVIISCFFSIPATAADQTRLFADNLCLQVKFYQGQPLSDLSLLTKLGVKWVREEDRWSSLEPEAGNYNPLSDSLKQRIKYYKANNIGMVFILAYENDKAYPNSPSKPNHFVNAQAYANYAAYIANQLKQTGVRFALELWNEPHNSGFAKSEHFGGQWQGKPPSPWVDHYVMMANMATEAIKRVDPAIPVMVNDDMWIIHYFFLEKGLSPKLDGLSIHPYSGGRPPEVAAVSFDTEWTKPYQVVDVDQSFTSAMRRLKQQASKSLDDPAIWITEWGWQVGEQSPTGETIDEERVASYLPRAYILAEAAGAKTACWFSAQDTVDGPMGLKTNDGRLRPAFFAYQTMAEKLGNKQYVCEVHAKHDQAKAFLFKGQDNWVITQWNTAENAKDQNVHYQEINNKQHVPACAEFKR